MKAHELGRRLLASPDDLNAIAVVKLHLGKPGGYWWNGQHHIDDEGRTMAVLLNHRQLKPKSKP